MGAIKANGYSCSLVNQAETGKQKSSGYTVNAGINKKYIQQKQAFGGASSVNESFGKKAVNYVCRMLDKLQRRIETGGFITEFLVIDFCGLIIPRVIQAYHRNEKELGHPNVPAAQEEFTREILSGPSMFLIPFAFLAGSKKMFGSASHVKLNTLKKFKGIIDKTIKENKNSNHVKNFYENVVDTIYKNRLDKDSKSNIVEGFLGLHNADSKKLIKNQKAKVEEMLISANKKIGNSKELGTSMADSSRIKLDDLSKNVGDFVEECHNYSTDKDILKIFANGSGKLVEKIHEYKEGARKLVTTTAVVTMSAFLCYIPHLYNQNKEYPGLAGLSKDTAEKEGGKK